MFKPTPWHNMKYKLLTDGDLDINHLLSCQNPHSSEPLAVLAWCKPSERAHSSSELAQAEETPVLRQSSPVLLATAQAQNVQKESRGRISLGKTQFKCGIPHVREQQLMQSSQRLQTCS